MMGAETIREALWDILAKDIPELKENIWEPSVAGPQLETPHVVVRKASDAPQANKYAGVLHNYEVWPHVKRTTFQTLDSLAADIQASLTDRVFFVGQIPHYIEYDGSSTEDIVIEDWDLLTRALTFRIHELDWLTHLEVEPDSVEAMLRWTEKQLVYQTNPAKWNPTAAIPAVYWRQEATLNTEQMNWGAWHTVRLHGHVITPNDRNRRKVVESIVRQLSLDRLTHMSDGSYMRFQSISADSGYDAFGQGQITLEVRFGVLKQQKRTSLKRVYFNDTDKAKGAATTNDSK